MNWLFGSKKEEAPKEGVDSISIKLDKGNLKKIELDSSFKMPEKPKIETRADLEKKKELELKTNKVPFDIGEEFDQSTYLGRF